MSEGRGIFEAAIDLAQFPEDRNKENRNYEQQELDAHLLAFSSQETVNSQSRNSTTGLINGFVGGHGFSRATRSRQTCGL
jgi:hypothetical protein